MFVGTVHMRYVSMNIYVQPVQFGTVHIYLTCPLAMFLYTFVVSLYNEKDKFCNLNVLASAVHILKLERYRED